MSISIYLTNLGKYNEGFLIGEWVELPATEEELQKAIERIGCNTPEYEEYFITDYESDFNIFVDEFMPLDDVNHIAEELAQIPEGYAEFINALLENGYLLGDAIEKVEDGAIYSACSDFTDLAYIYVEECCILDGVPESLQNYFDYEAYGRDLSFELEAYFTAGGNCLVIY